MPSDDPKVPKVSSMVTNQFGSLLFQEFISVALALSDEPLQGKINIILKKLHFIYSF